MCERCNRRTECTKRLSIQRFPQVIVIRILGNNSCLLTSLASYVYMQEVMVMLNNLNQIWIVLRLRDGLSVKAPCMCPSRSLTWTSGPTDLSTVVKLPNFSLNLSTVYSCLLYSSIHAFSPSMCMLGSAMCVTVCHLIYFGQKYGVQWLKWENTHER